MPIDHHLHIENRAERAICDFQSGLDYINHSRLKDISILGFSDHAYAFIEAEPINFNTWHEERRRLKLSDYVNTVQDLRKEAGISIMLGLEVDYSPDKEKEISVFINNCRKLYPFDFFIGSIHWINDWGFDLDSNEYMRRMEEMGVANVYDDYFSIVKKAVSSNLFDIIGHIDIIKLFGGKPGKKEYIHEIVRHLKTCDQAIEINTNGLNKPINETYPCMEFVQACIKEDVPLTLGSDAHEPKRVGENFTSIISHLATNKCRKLCYYKNGKREYMKI